MPIAPSSRLSTYVGLQNDSKYRTGQQDTDKTAQRQNSMLTFEQQPHLGAANIVAKLQVGQYHANSYTIAENQDDTS